MHLQAGTHRMHEHILCTFLGALGLADRERGFEKVWGSQERARWARVRQASQLTPASSSIPIILISSATHYSYNYNRYETGLVTLTTFIIHQDQKHQPYVRRVLALLSTQWPMTTVNWTDWQLYQQRMTLEKEVVRRSASRWRDPKSAMQGIFALLLLSSIGYHTKSIRSETVYMQSLSGAKPQKTKLSHTAARTITDKQLIRTRVKPLPPSSICPPPTTISSVVSCQPSIIARPTRPTSIWRRPSFELPQIFSPDRFTDKALAPVLHTFAFVMNSRLMTGPARYVCSACSSQSFLFQ